MENYKLDDMTRGWFVGNFSPTAFTTDKVEVAYKEYEKNDYEVAHYHRIATEITVIIEGSVEMNGKEYTIGDIIVINPNEVTNFKAKTKAKTLVVKMPGVLEDKYIVEGE